MAKEYWHKCAFKMLVKLATGYLVDIFDAGTAQWSSGATLQMSRMWHSCSMILKNNQSQTLTQIVVGGSSRNTVEIFDDLSNVWIFGPPLPKVISYAAIVNDPLNGVILIGGLNDNYDTKLDTLYRLRDTGSQWELLTIKLKTGMSSPTAFLIPDNITKCQ